MRLFQYFTGLTAGLLALQTLSAGEHLGFRVPDGFVVTQFADDSMAHDIFSMTLDSKGRVVVAGKGYIKILEDTDHDGKADKSTQFSKMPMSGAHGMYFDDKHLVCVGDNSVWRIRDENGDSVADGDPELWLADVKHSEHAANGIVRGPDGWFYLACGNDAGISEAHITLPGSPVKKPNAGAIVRISPDGKSSEVIADGFRNPYDLDFNSSGTLFTYDADGERDHHLPWYTPTRIFDVAQGRHHGWILKGFQHAWGKPATLFDVVDRLYEVGRGSPTGVMVYRQNTFPKKYHDGLFAICWTFGRVYFFPMKRNGSTYEAEIETFMETVGDTGFAPVDIAVGKQGEMYIAIGGRGTSGGVFCIRHVGEATSSRKKFTSSIQAVLTAPQPLSSWSRAAWVPEAKALGRAAFELAAANKKLPASQRIRALEILVELFGGITPNFATGVSDIDPAVTARVIWTLSRSPDSEAARNYFAKMTSTKNPQVARAAWEAVGALPSPLDGISPDWKRGLAATDRRVRGAAVMVAHTTGSETFSKVLEKTWTMPSERLGYLMACSPAFIEQSPTNFFNRCLRLFPAVENTSMQTDVIRLFQMALGDFLVIQNKPTIHDGFIAVSPERISREARRSAATMVSSAFPSKDPNFNHEAARLFAMLESDDTSIPQKLTTLWTPDSAVEDDIHYLAVLSRLAPTANREVRAKSARALLRLHAKMTAQGKEPSRMWPVHVANLFGFLQQRDPTLAQAMIEDSEFKLAEHAAFAKAMPPKEQIEAARKFLKLAAQSNGSFVTPEVIDLWSILPPAESFPILRAHWDKPSLRDAIAQQLAAHAQPEDRDRLIEALGSFEPTVVEKAATALLSLNVKAGAKEFLAAIQSLRRLSQESQRNASDAVVRLLAAWTGRSPENSPKIRAAWIHWFQQTFPAEAKEQFGQELDAAAWRTRLNTINWSDGDSKRGKQVFEARSCYQCHSGGRRFGPDLTGITGRLSRQDLFVSIVDPNRDVSPAYYPKVITTQSGETYTGTIVYEAPTLKLLQTGPDTTVRIPGETIVTETTSRISQMPTGLLEGATDQELADLYAYLQTLKK
jgi:putative membrane-bound dehydrogenase-like protein